MDQIHSSLAPLKSALFVDFDNIYIGLSKTDPTAAERFASDPSRWLAWLERGLPVRGGGNIQPRQRSVLIRRCYPNPDAGFRRFRSYFTSAAFSVIDCPSMTSTGKNSSDIYMVMDILDTLNHKTNFDEFIIFSGDSDFMPVLLRLRAHDRRTTTLAIDFMPPAYKAACDLVITEEEFIEEALGITGDGNGYNGMQRSRVPLPVLKEMANRVFEAACSEGEVAGANLPDILKDFRVFRDSNNWLGFGTSQRLAEALALHEPRLSLVKLNPMMYKIVLAGETSVSLPALAPQQEEEAAPVSLLQTSDAAALLPDRLTPTGDRAQGGNGAEKFNRAENTRLRDQILALVREMVANSRSAILLARASQYVVSKLGPQVLDSQWAGAGSFKRLLLSASSLGLEITTQPEPGYIFDPKRHRHPSLNRPGSVRSSQEDGAVMNTSILQDQAADYTSGEPTEEYDMNEDEEEGEYQEALPSLDEFIRRVSRVTGAPDLDSHQYAVVFRGIIHELHEIEQGRKTYNTYQSSKSVSEWCAEQGAPISRSDIVLIFKGIIFQDGVRFGKRPGSYTERELASIVRSNIKALIRRSRLEISEYDERLLDQWIYSGLEAGMEVVDQADNALTPADNQTQSVE